MVGKIILTVVVLMAAFFTVQLIEQRIAPTDASNLAISQIKEDGSREQLRIEQNAQNWLDPLAALIVMGFLIWIWKNTMVNFIKSLYVVCGVHDNG